MDFQNVRSLSSTLKDLFLHFYCLDKCLISKKKKKNWDKAERGSFFVTVLRVGFRGVGTIQWLALAEIDQTSDQKTQACKPNYVRQQLLLEFGEAVSWQLRTGDPVAIQSR